MEKCRVIIGVRGFGKSVLVEHELLRIARRGDCATLLLDRPGTLARAAVGQAWAHAKKEKVFFEQASRLDKTPSWPFWQAQTCSNPLEQLNANEIADEQFAHAFLAKRGLKDAEDKPWTKQYLMAGIAVWRSQPAPCHLADILASFEMGHPRRVEMLDRARDRGAARMFRDLEFRSLRSPNTYSVESGAAYRMLLICRSPALWARHGNSFDWEWVVESKIQVYFDLSGVSVEIARALGIFAYAGFNNAIRRLSQRHQKVFAGAVWLEEAGAMDFVTPYVLTSMQEDRKYGSSWSVISQTVEDFKGERAFETLMGVSEEAYFFRMNTGIERAAKALANPTYDPTVIHRVEQRFGVIGQETIKTVNEGERLDEEGNIIGTDRRTGQSKVPIYGYSDHAIMKTPNLHLQDYMTDLATLPIGTCFYAGMNGVSLMNVKMEPQPWPIGLTKLRTERAIAEIRARPQYRVPQLPSKQPQERRGAASRFGANGTD